MTLLEGQPRLLVLDLLESYARERDIHVVLERLDRRTEWVCVLRSGDSGLAVRSVGNTAREAISEALRHEGVEVPDVRHAPRCANCGREPHSDENVDDEWRAVSQRLGDLIVFCPQCWRREFSDAAAASGLVPLAERRGSD